MFLKGSKFVFRARQGVVNKTLAVIVISQHVANKSTCDTNRNARAVHLLDLWDMRL